MKHSELKQREPVFANGLDCGMQCMAIMACNAFFETLGASTVPDGQRKDLLRSFVRQLNKHVGLEPAFNADTVHSAIERIRGVEGGDKVADQLTTLLLGDA